MQQLTMTGDDWTSERERKVRARAEAARKKAALACANKLESASKALNEYLHACNACSDASGSRGADDGRMRLMRDLNEYSGYLTSVYAK